MEEEAFSLSPSWWILKPRINAAILVPKRKSLEPQWVNRLSFNLEPTNASLASRYDYLLGCLIIFPSPFKLVWIMFSVTCNQKISNWFQRKASLSRMILGIKGLVNPEERDKRSKQKWQQWVKKRKEREKGKARKEKRKNTAWSVLYKVGCG